MARLDPAGMALPLLIRRLTEFEVPAVGL